MPFDVIKFILKYEIFIRYFYNIKKVKPVNVILYFSSFASRKCWNEILRRTQDPEQYSW